MELSAQNGSRVPGSGTVTGYLVNAAIPTGKVREFNVVWKVVTLSVERKKRWCLVIGCPGLL